MKKNPQSVDAPHTVIRKGRRGNPVRVEIIIYSGYEYRRYPDSPHQHLRHYYQRSHRGEPFLHRQVWRDASGQKIPSGFAVHHRDHNWDNNQPSNLACVPIALHTSHHAVIWANAPENRAFVLANMAAIQPLAAQWHGSRAGRAWHRRHARWIQATKVLKPHLCPVCQNPFESWHADAQYCSGACYQRARRRSGVANVKRLCQHCADPFITSKHRGARSCSRRCAAVLRWQTRRRLKEPTIAVLSR